MAAAYIFHLAKNHPFLDGNKRVAAVSPMVFLLPNGLEIDGTNEGLERLTEPLKPPLREFDAAQSQEASVDVVRPGVACANPPVFLEVRERALDRPAVMAEWLLSSNAPTANVGLNVEDFEERPAPRLSQPRSTWNSLGRFSGKTRGKRTTARGWRRKQFSLVVKSLRAPPPHSKCPSNTPASGAGAEGSMSFLIMSSS